MFPLVCFFFDCQRPVHEKGFNEAKRDIQSSYVGCVVVVDRGWTAREVAVGGSRASGGKKSVTVVSG
jgi:hypothetical protein